MNNKIKPYIKLMILIFTLSVSPISATTWTAENCTNRAGIIVKANEYNPDNPSLDKGGHCKSTADCNGQTFCVSQTSMNWWSALTWCEAHGGKLASMSSLCPNTNLVNDFRIPNVCPNIQGLGLSGGYGGRVHSRTTHSLNASQNWVVGQDGAIFGHNKVGENHLAICE